MSETEASANWWTTVLAGDEGTLSQADSDEQYLVLPTASSPRVAVDRNERRAVRDAIQRMVSSRTKNAAVRSIAGSASTVVARKKPAWTVAAGDSRRTLRQHLMHVLDRDLRISVSVGPPRPNRKPVVRCYGSDGMFAVAKLGLEPHTAAMVRNEADWLATMTQTPLTDITTAPVLYSGDFNDHPLLVMGALDLTSDLGLSVGAVPLSVVREFSERYRTGGRLAGSPWWSSLRSRIGDDDETIAFLDEVSASPELVDVETSAWHGDWSPWNMGWATSGQLAIWDWERTMSAVPVGFDICHLHYQYGNGFDAATPELTALGVAPELHTITKQLYLLELCGRHREAGALHTERHARVMATLAALRPVRSMT